MQNGQKNNFSFNPHDLLTSIGRIWKKSHMLIFFVCFILSIMVGFKIWQQAIYGNGWDEARKQDYLKLNSKSVKFQEKEFEKVLQDVQNRKNHSTIYQTERNLFKNY